MRQFMGLAWRELRAQRVTSTLILIAVVLSTLMTTVAGRSIGILNTMRTEQAAGLNGHRHATFHNVDEAGLALLAGDNRLDYAGSLKTLGTAPLGESGMSVIVREHQGDDLQRVYPENAVLKQGRLPETPQEIALPEDALKFLGFTGGIGDAITLDLSIIRLNDLEAGYEFTHTFTLSGILESSYLAYSSGTVMGVAGPGAVEALLPERYQVYSVDVLVRDLSAFQATVDDLVVRLGCGGEDVQYNWVYLSALGVDYGGETVELGAGFPFLAVTVALIGALVLLAAGLVIYNILKISVAKRVRQYGTLRALGAERGQLYRLVALQLLLLCGAGIPVGLALGAAAARTVLRMALSLLAPEAFQAQSMDELLARLSASGGGGAWPLVLSAAVTLAFAAVAALPAARYAARVSPTVAMGGAGVRVRRRRRGTGRIRNFPAFYARLNLGRNPGRTAITVLSLVMSITVFVALQSFTGLLDAGRAVQELHTGDYALSNTNPGLTPAEESALRNDPAVAALATTRLAVYLQDEGGALPIDTDLKLAPAETLQVAALDGERLAQYGAGLDAAAREKLMSGAGALVKNPIAFQYEGATAAATRLEAGDVVRVNGREVEILGEYPSPVTVGGGGFINGVQLIVSDGLYTALTGSERFQELAPTLAEGADAAAFEGRLDALCEAEPGSTWLSYRETDAQLAESFAQIHLLCWGLILFIGLIGVLNIINTVYTNLHTRLVEIGVQRAVGMSAAGLYQTFLWEGAYYAILASVLGGAAGTVCTAFVDAAVNGALTLPQIPAASILAAAAVSVAACLAATAVPLRAIARKNIVDSIETAE